MIHKDIPQWAWRGWQVELGSGEVINEGELDWIKVPKGDIVKLSLLFDGRRWDIVNKKGYFQKKRGSVGFGVCNVNEAVVESRTIGYYDDNGGKVCYTVNERTGDFKLEVI